MYIYNIYIRGEKGREKFFPKIFREKIFREKKRRKKFSEKYIEGKVYEECI